MPMMCQRTTRAHLYCLNCCEDILVLLALFVLKPDPDVIGRAFLSNSKW